MDRTSAVTTAALYAYEAQLERADTYIRNSEAMDIHAVAVAGHVSDELAAKLLARPTGLTACREQHYALNRVDYHTVAAMLCDLRHDTNGAAFNRKRAEQWSAYFNDEARQLRASDEDEARCAEASARGTALEEWHR